MLRRLLLKNLTLKLFAFALAVVLFVFVREDQTAVMSTTVGILVAVPDDKVLISEPLDKVTIGVEGKYSRIRKFAERATEPLLINLTGREGEQFSFEPEMFKVPPGVRVRTVRPAAMLLKFDAKTRRTVPVEPTTKGDCGPRFRVTQLVVQPPEVLVEGAKSVVDRLQRVRTQPVELSGRSQSITLQVPLSPQPLNLTYLGPATYRISITIEEKQGTRAITGRPIEVVNVADDTPGFELSPVKVDITLHGRVSLLDSLDVDSLVAYVDASGIDPGKKMLHARPILFDPPEGLELVELKPKETTLARRKPEPPPPPDAGIDAAPKEK